jgi:2-oxoglutarate dehydrogenase E1 component
MDKEVSV